MNFISQVKKDLDILKKIIPQESTKIESLLTKNLFKFIYN